MLAACARAPDALSVRAASIDAGVLTARLDWQPAANVLAALEHGIALDFVVTVSARAPGAFGVAQTQQRRHRHVQLRYFPLSRQYQLRDLDLAQTRSFAARSLALAAFEELRLPLPDWQEDRADSYSVAVALDRGALPGALRLPALLEPSWHIASGDFTWQPAAR